MKQITEQKKDKLFVIILGIVLVNLVYYFSGNLYYLIKNYTSFWSWTITFANGVALWGILFLLRIYRRNRKIAKETEQTANQSTED